MVDAEQQRDRQGFARRLENAGKSVGEKHGIVLDNQHAARLLDRADVVCLVSRWGRKFSSSAKEYCGVRKLLAFLPSENRVTGRRLNTRTPKPSSKEIATMRGTPTLTQPPLPARAVAAS